MVTDNVQGSSYLLGQRYCACFVLKIALRRGEGEKSEGVQINKQSTRTFDTRNNFTAVFRVIAFNLCRCFSNNRRTPMHFVLFSLIDMQMEAPALVTRYVPGVTRIRFTELQFL